MHANSSVGNVHEDPEVTTRTTTEDGMVLAVKVKREAMMGSPIPVSVEFTNRGTKPVSLNYSRRVLMVHPVVYWINMSGPMPLTKEGEAELGGSREPLSTRSSLLNPGESWETEFDVAKYYKLSLPAQYLLGISFRLERADPNTGKMIPIRLDVRGVRFVVSEPDHK
jgi:hypothetical protein